MEYEQDFQNALMQMCDVCVTFMLIFRVFDFYDIHFDLQKQEILAPLAEKEHILDFFQRNGFTVKQCIGMWYQISVVS